MTDYESSYKLLEQLDEFEKMRKSLVRGHIISAVVGIVVAIGLAFLFGYFDRLCGYAFFGAIFLYQISIINKRKEYRRLFKEIFVKGPLSKSFDNLEFWPDKGLNSYVIRDTHMIRMGNKFHSDDYIRANYKGINFEQSDVEIKEEKGSGKNRSSVTYFKGRWMVFDFNKSFYCNLLVCSKGFNNITTKKSLFQSESEYEKIEFEDMQFNKEFNVYGKNINEAFYLLTPQLIENIRRLKANTTGDLILCFCNNRLHVGVNNHLNAFEPTVFRKIDVQSINDELFGEIGLITQFVDELKLNVNVYK